MFKKGDLIKFNDEGIELFRYVTGSVGVISSDRLKIYEADSYSAEKNRIYTYDLIVCGTLFRNIPEEFIKRITQNDEKNT